MDETYKQRVEVFWRWFPEVSQRFFDTIESGDCADLAGEVSAFMGATLPGLAWVFGPGEQGGHSFTVSGEGIVAKQLLAEHWLSQSVECKGWTFYESRQPNTNLSSVAIEIKGLGHVDAENFLIRTTVDEEREIIDIAAWHPLFETLTEDHHAQLLFLLLDETLGEFGTQTWLGSIAIEPLERDEIDGRTVLQMDQLPKFINDVKRYHGWEKLSPLRSYTGYSIREPRETRRGDTIAGTTCIPNIVFELLENEGVLSEDPLADTGASLAFLELDSQIFPDGDQAGVRHNIEEALEEALDKDSLGRPLGGAAGENASYIDLLLIDGERSKQSVESTLDQLGLTNRYAWHSFTELPS